MHTPVFSFTFEHMHRIEPRTFASRDRLDTRAKCLSWSTRYSGQMPLLIDYILGPNAFLDGLDCHECQPQQHYFTNSQTSLRCPRVCHSFWDLHPPFKFVLRALWNKKINFCSQKQIWYPRASYTDYLFFPVLTTVPFWTVSSWSGHGHGRMGFGKSYCRNWGMGLNLRI